MSKNILYGEIVDGELKFDNKDDWDRLFKIYSGQSIEISVQPLGKRRNTKQNRFYWKVVVNSLAMHFGYTDNEMHKALKLKFDVESTSKLTVIDFSEYIESIIRWAEFEHGFILNATNTPKSSG